MSETEDLIAAARGHRVRGWAKDEALRESLRLLIAHHGYTVTDVAPMFGVCRELVRQWCERFGIVRPYGRAVCHRVWDDTRNEFLPWTGRMRQRRKVVAHRAERRKIREDRAVRQREKQAMIRQQIAALWARLGRVPSLLECAAEVYGRSIAPSASAPMLLLAYYGLPSTRAGAMAVWRRDVGLPERSPGYAGWNPENQAKHPRIVDRRAYNRLQYQKRRVPKTATAEAA